MMGEPLKDKQVRFIGNLETKACLTLDEEPQGFYLGRDIASAVEWLKDRIKIKQTFLDDTYTCEDTLMGSEFPLKMIDKAFEDCI